MDTLSKVFRDEGFANLENEVLIELVSYIQLLRGKSIFFSCFELSISEDHSTAKDHFLFSNLLIPN